MARHAELITVQPDNTVHVFSSKQNWNIQQFHDWLGARRFAWGLAHENQLPVVGEDRRGRAVQWARD